MQPKVTVITPVRIRAPEELTWLSECIRSVLSQSEFYIEHVIVDDNSPAQFDVAGAVRLAAGQDDRVSLYRLRYEIGGISGVSAARNIAAQRAKAPLLLPLDADDLLDPDTVKNYLSAWKGTGFLYPSVKLFDGDAGDVIVKPEPYDFERLLSVTYLLVGNLHLKSDWERAGGWKMSLAAAFEDWEYWVNFGRLGVCGTPCPDALYCYRRNPFGRISLTRRNPSIGIEAHNQIRQLHADLYGGNRPMACCGGRGNQNPITEAARPMSTEPERFNIAGAQSGLVLIHYLSENAALVPWYGPVTKTRYVFSAERNMGYVDARDAAQMVQMFESRRPIFELAPVAVQAEPEQVALQAEPIEFTAENPSTFTVAAQPEPAMAAPLDEEPADVAEDIPEDAPVVPHKRKRKAA